MNVRFVNPGRLYLSMKNELDRVYFDVMSAGDLVDRQQLRDGRLQHAPAAGVERARVVHRLAGRQRAKEDVEMIEARVDQLQR